MNSLSKGLQLGERGPTPPGRDSSPLSDLDVWQKMGRNSPSPRLFARVVN